MGETGESIVIGSTRKALNILSECSIMENGMTLTENFEASKVSVSSPLKKGLSQNLLDYLKMQNGNGHLFNLKTLIFWDLTIIWPFRWLLLDIFIVLTQIIVKGH